MEGANGLQGTQRRFRAAVLPGPAGHCERPGHVAQRMGRPCSPSLVTKGDLYNRKTGGVKTSVLIPCLLERWVKLSSGQSCQFNYLPDVGRWGLHLRQPHLLSLGIWADNMHPVIASCLLGDVWSPHTITGRDSHPLKWTLYHIGNCVASWDCAPGCSWSFLLNVSPSPLQGGNAMTSW